MGIIGIQRTKPVEFYLRWKDMVSAWVFRKLQSLLTRDLTGQ